MIFRTAGTGRIGSAIGLVSLLLVPNAMGQVSEPAATLSLEQAVQSALANHPALAAQSARVSAAAGLVLQAGLRPNPRVSLQSENWNFTGADPISTSINSDQFAYFTQPIETAGKRNRRLELGKANQTISGLERDLLERQIASRVKVAYWATVSADRISDLWKRQVETFQQVVDYHDARVREGALAEADLIRVRLEADRYAVAAASAALDAEQARIDLFREMGYGTVSPVILTGALEEVPATPAIDFAQVLATRVEMRLAQEDTLRAGANVRLQQSLSHPDFEAGAGYKRNLGFNTLLATIQFSLPTSNRNQGNIQAAFAEETAARLSEATVATRIRVEVVSARSELESRRNQLKQLLDPSLAKAQESVRIAEAAYREGGTELLRLLDAERLRIELEVSRVQTLGQFHRSLVNLETALGVNP